MFIQKTTLLLFLTFFSIISFAQSDFLDDQKRYERVRTAILEKEGGLVKELAEAHITLDELSILIVAYKEEDEMEIFAKNKNDTTYNKLMTYDICSKSGDLGPKRRRGDYQVPEGFYYINRFNPASSYYLSLGLNYPNTSDRKKSNAANLGGDIFVHGSCVTIGCLPMTDDIIKEIYLYAIHARNNGQEKIPFYIFPFRMTESNFNKYKSKNSGNKALISFWTNIKSGYDLFQNEKKQLNISVNNKGDYIFMK